MRRRARLGRAYRRCRHTGASGALTETQGTRRRGSSAYGGGDTVVSDRSPMTDQPAPGRLAALAEDDVQRVLCIVAHPDDMEYGASAAVAAWTGAGVEVSYLLLTRGEAGMAESPEEVAPLRAGEQQRACDIVGVSQLRFLDHPDGMLVSSLDLRRDIARAVREVRPDLVVTANFDLEAYGGLRSEERRVGGAGTAG